MPDYVVAFDLAEAGFRGWEIIAFGLGFVGVGVVLVSNRDRLSGWGPLWLRSAFAWLFLVFNVLWSSIALTASCGQYHRLASALHDGRVSVVEGPVENFVPMPYSGHAMERFTVQGVSFAYSDYVVTAGFNNTASHGGPIRAGRRVRVTYVGRDIVRLEVER